MTKHWPVHDAKARFSELLDRTIEEGPQIVTRRGAETVVLVPIDQWRRIEASARLSLKDLLLAEEARSDDLAPPRKPQRRRKPVRLD